jgi:hypothetical protein
VLPTPIPDPVLIRYCSARTKFQVCVCGLRQFVNQLPAFLIVIFILTSISSWSHEAAELLDLAEAPVTVEVRQGSNTLTSPYFFFQDTNEVAQYFSGNAVLPVREKTIKWASGEADGERREQMEERD